MKHNRSGWQINALGKEGIEETIWWQSTVLLCSRLPWLRGHSKETWGKARERRWFPVPSRWRLCPLLQKPSRLCVSMATRNMERGGEKWFHVKPELLSLFCRNTIQCKMEIKPVIQIWVHLMKKIRVSHFRQKGYFQMQI